MHSGLRLFIFLFILFSVNAVSAADPKVWEIERQIVKDIGDINIQMQSMFDRSNPTKFQVSVYSRSKKISVIFRGVCSELLTVTAHSKDPRILDLERFFETKSGQDLPIADLLNVTQETLSDQCDQQPQVIRVKFMSAIYDKGGKYNYQGTMTKSSGWKLQDGIIKTAFDHAYIVDLTAQGVQYKGSCETNPTLPLAPVYKTQRQKAFAKTPEMGSYYSWAMVIHKRYLKECPETKAIKYTLDPIPEDYYCPPEEKCYLAAAEDSDWKVRKIGFDIKGVEEGRITDFTDMTETLAAGNFEVLPEYSNFYAFYFESFIQLYSDHCREHIKNPVGRSIQTIERKFDQFGPISDTPLGPPREVFIEQKYESLFDQYYGSWESWGTSRFMKAALKEQKRGGHNPGGAMYGAMAFFSGNYNKLERIIRGNCTSEKVQIVYENLYRYGYTETPLTPKQKEMRASVAEFMKGIGITTAEKSAQPIPKRQQPLRQTTPQTQFTKSKVPSTASINKKHQTNSMDFLKFAWITTVDGQSLELVLWTVPNSEKQVHGFIYASKHDCLMTASITKYDNQFELEFGSLGDSKRENNCQLNTTELKGLYKATFKGTGFITVDEDKNTFNFKSNFLYLGKILADPNNEEFLHVTFKKAPVTTKMLEIITTYEHQFIKKPDQEFLSGLKK